MGDNSEFGDYIPTVADKYAAKVRVGNTPVVFNLWDTAGQEEFKNLRKVCYPNTNVFLACFAVDNKEAFKNVEDLWIPEITQCCPEAAVILVGTKADTRLTTGSPSSISTDQMVSYAMNSMVLPLIKMLIVIVVQVITISIIMEDATEPSLAPSTPTESIESAEKEKKSPKPHHLHTTWSFYVNELPNKQTSNPSGKHEGHQIRCLGQCSTVEEFWKVFKMTEKPSELQSTEAFYLMRNPYDPQWEKPEHANGGRWRLRHTDVRNTDYLWCELAMGAVGEKLGQLVDSHNFILGVGVSPRPSSVIVDIWTASVVFDADKTAEFAEKLNRLILPQSLNFKIVFYESFDEYIKYCSVRAFIDANDGSLSFSVKIFIVREAVPLSSKPIFVFAFVPSCFDLSISSVGFIDFIPMSALQPSSFSGGGLVATTNSNVAAPTTDLMETKKQQQQIAQQQGQQDLCKKHVDPNAMDSGLSTLGSGGSLGMSTLPTGAAIYGQLVTFDQLSQLSHQSPRSKQVQQSITSAAAIGVRTAVAVTSPSPIVTSSVAMTTTVVSSNSASSLLNVMSASAYANLDPSYSLKNKSVGVTQQQPMDISEPMDLSSSSCSPSSGVLPQQAPCNSTMTMTSSLNTSNTYSYPTFPYCNTATTTGSSVTGVSLSLSSSAATMTTAAVSTSAQPVSGDVCMLAFGRRQHQPPQRLLVRMSVKLIQTYETINEVYFRKKRRREQACEDNIMKRDRKGHEVTTTTGTATGNCCLPATAGTTNRPCCCQLHHGRPVGVGVTSGAANGVNASAWSTTNSFPQQPQAQAHLYDVGNRQQQQKITAQASSFPAPQNPPQSSTTTAPRCAVGNTSVASTSNATNNRTQRHQNSQAPAVVGSNSSSDFLKIGAVWLDRYEITDIKGKGTFGQVFRAHDRKTHEEVAIKVIKNRRQFLAQAEIEIKLLREIAHFQENEQRAAEVGANYVVNLKGYFTYQGHWCLVFECLSYNLYELLTYTHFRGVSLHLTMKFARQLCAALVFLSRPDVRVIHCDLKPENILLVTPKRSDLKVIDFGSSCHVNENVHQYIQSRFYRAPEVLLNLDYGLSIDMWSLGCILVEMHTGEPLFSGSNELEQLLQIVEVLGLPPLWMLEKSPKLEHFFERVSDVSGSLCSSTSSNSSGQQPDRMDTSGQTSPTSPFSKACVTIKGIVYRPRRIYSKGNMTMRCRFAGPQTRPLREVLGRDTGGPGGRRPSEEGHSPEDYDKFIDLVAQMLVYDPRARIRPDEALAHRFFDRKSSSVTPSAAATAAANSTPENHSTTNITAPSTTTNTAPSLVVVPKRFPEEPSVTVSTTATTAIGVAGGGFVDGSSPAYLTFAPNQQPPSDVVSTLQQ
nr:dual specificity [Hymenolepis microstoma]